MHRKDTFEKARTRRRGGAIAAVLAATLAIGACAFAFGCSSNQAASSSSQAEEVDVTEVVVEEGDQPEFVGGADPLLDFAANSSSIELTGDSNQCYSPASYFFALSMVAAGADGDAQEQMLNVLGLEDTSALNEYCKIQLEQISNTDEDSTIAVADSLWSNTSYSFLDDYVTTAGEYYGAGAFDVEFGTDQTSEMISGWISENTRGLLSPQIQTDSGMVALLVNTLYFKDMWITAFAEGETMPATFHTPDGDVTADFMHNTTDYGTYIVGDNYTAAQMPFAGGSTCTFYLPNEGTSLQDLLGTPNSMQLLLAAQPNSDAEIKWSMPRFKGESTFTDLAECAQAMGIVDAFDPNTPGMFQNMIVSETQADMSFYISDVLQETSIDVNEFGVEAAAYTSITARATALAREPQDVVDFTLDRPFAYAITASNGAPLFVGVVINPTA